MPKYIIERAIPGAGNLSKEELQGISQKCGKRRFSGQLRFRGQIDH